ncbi:unnamed protein product, partial [Schistosoma curassoni]|uniref:Retrovirus-related Pol polyprotein from transposon TNT 1-94 n=1 Tax=Schistosoma curassoni TaxID=6186 RepID=A0A183JS49_9TREM
PTYGANNPRVWFAQIEALFTARGIRSEANKYAHVVGALSIEKAADVGDLIDHVPQSEPYGAEIGIVPLHLSQRRHFQSTKFSLVAANNTVIKTYGEQSLILDLGLRRRFTWVFIVAEIKQPILGADFLGAYDLLVDIGKK